MLYFLRLDPNPDSDQYWNEQLDPDPHKSQHSAQNGAVDAHNLGVEAHNGAWKVCGPVVTDSHRSGIRIRIHI
jgi:hypothetical protein